MADKTKLNKKDFIFEKKKGETLIKNPGQINGIDFTIWNLTDCEVYLMDHSAQVFVDDCKNCTIHIGPVESSIFVRDCENIKISCAGAQVRVSDSKNVDCFIYCQSDPVVEKSSNIRFGPYNFAYPLQGEHFIKAKLDIGNDHWSQIYDFDDPSGKNPCWSIISPDQYPGQVSKSVDGQPEPENPVPVNVAYGGTLNEPLVVGAKQEGGDADQGGMMAFDIKTGAENAQNMFEQTNPDENAFDNNFAGEVKLDGGMKWDNAPNSFQTPGQNSFPQANPDISNFNFDNADNLFQPQTQSNQSPGLQNKSIGSNQSPSITTQSPSKTGKQDVGFGLFVSPTKDPFDPNYDPEEEERKQKLRKREADRMALLEERARHEREKKQERRIQAQADLKKWNDDRVATLKKKLESSKAERGPLGEQKYENTWDKVVSNVNLKEGEHGGKKDVTRFKEALLNKKKDATGGLKGFMG